MSYKKGIVEGINVKEPREGQYGKFAGYGIKIGDEWFNGLANEDKHTGQCVVKDSSYNPVLQGMEIEFMYKVNDKGYNDIDKKTMKILSSGSNVPNKPVEPRSAPVGTNTPQEDKSAPNGLIWAECVTAATNLAGKKSVNIEVKVNNGENEEARIIEVTGELIVRMADYYYKIAMTK